MSTEIPAQGPGGRPLPIPDHELLARIGGGSYGEVWLARSATGVLRAVKILVRTRFGSDPQPFEREFEGLRRFEPVSRDHDHVVDVLHIGRDEDVLYYVMELADDASGAATPGKAVDPDRYEADTLSRRLREMGCVPITECLEIARALARALEHLHSNGLIHRDVKPSNVVFVDGVLKLADVGLVSAPDATASLVGTEGFIPPEGPGTVQADLFALGKILYEASSGLDRMEFPAAPDWVCDEGSPRGWREFNEIVLKCCEKDADRRYASARELLADIELLEAGGSLVGRRRRRNFWHFGKWACGGGLAAGLLFSLGALVNPGPQPGGDHTEPAWIAPVGEMVDLGPHSPVVDRHRTRVWDASPDGKRLVFESDGRLLVRDLDRGATYPVLEDPADGWITWNPRWLGGSRRLLCLATDRPPSAANPGQRAILLVDVDQRRIERVVHRGTELFGEMAASAASGTIVVRAWRQQDAWEGLLVIDLESGAVERRDSHGSGRVGDFSPDGRWLTFWKSRTARDGSPGFVLSALEVDSGREVEFAGLPPFSAHGTWSPDGRWLYFVAGDSGEEDEPLNLWRMEIDPASGTSVAAPQQLTTHMNTKVLFPQFVPATGELLVARASSTNVIQCARTDALGEVAQLASGVEPRLTLDGQWVFFRKHGTEREGLYAIPTHGSALEERLTAESPLAYHCSSDGSEVALLEPEGEGGRLTIMDRATGGRRAVASLSSRAGAMVAWSPDDSWLAFTDGADLCVIRPDGSGRRILGSVFAWHDNVWESPLRWSPDGSKVAGFGYPDREARDGPIENVHLYVADLNAGAFRSVTDYPGDAFWKEGLSWHPQGDRLTYMIYGPGDGESQVRIAYPDGRPTSLLVDQAEDHWEWVGTWHPGGRQFYFLGAGAGHEGPSVHILDEMTGVISHAEPPLDALSILPQWSHNGDRVMWAVGSSRRSLWRMRLD